jgi:hypothetical protein
MPPEEERKTKIPSTIARLDKIEPQVLVCLNKLQELQDNIKTVQSLNNTNEIQSKIDNLSELLNEMRNEVELDRKINNKKNNSIWIDKLVPLITSVLAILIAGWAAYETRLSVNETHRSTNSQVVIDLIEKYRDPSMLTAMKRLRKWKTKYPNNFDIIFKDYLNDNYIPKDKEEKELLSHIDADRRQVSSFFGLLAFLSRKQLIESDIISDYWSDTGNIFITDIIAPLDAAKAGYRKEEDHMYEHSKAFGKFFNRRNYELFMSSRMIPEKEKVENKNPK